MDEDSCSKFIGSLTKYLQSLCHSYVEFESGVELVGHIYLNVDTAKKIDYVLNETVCKNGANVVKFTSNSYHAQPVEKQKAKKAAPEPSSKSSESATKKTADDDDVIIVGSEASRVRGSRSAQAGQRAAQAGPVQRGVPGTSGNSGDRLQQGPGMGTFRSPRGPNPRMAGPYGGGGHPRMGGAYQQGYRMTGQMPSSGAQPAYPGAGGVTRMRHRTDIPAMSQPYLAAQQTGRSMPGMAGMAQGGAGIAPGRLDSSQRMQPPHVAMQRNPLQRAVNTGRRASDPVDTDITFMREEYVRPTNQPDMNINPATHMQAHMPGAQQHVQVPMTTAQAPPPSSSALSMMTQRFGFPQQHQDQQHQQLQGAAHLPPRFPGPYSHNVQYSSGTVSGQAGGGPGIGAQAVGSAQDMGSGMVSAQQDVGSGMPGVGAMGTTASGSSISPADSLNNSTMPTASQPATSTPVGLGGGMPLPVTTHSIFDEHLPVGSSSTQGETAGLTSQPHTSDYESGGDSTSTEKLASPHHLPSAQLRPLSISLVPVDTTSSKPGRERREATQKQNSQEEWVKDTRGVTGESSNSGFESEDLDDDDIDPSYQPPASRNTSKPKDPDGLRGTKRGKARQTGKSPRGKKRRTRSEASLHTEEQAEDANDVHSPVGAPSLPEHIASPSSPPSVSTPLDFSSPPPLSTPPPPQQMPGALPLLHASSAQSGRGENLYKPGSFVLLQISRDSERSRTRSMQCPAEVIPTPKGQPEGIWVHTLHSVGSGLWQLPNEDQRVDLRVEPGDIKQILSNASVKIIGSKVFYKFEDRTQKQPRKSFEFSNLVQENCLPCQGPLESCRRLTNAESLACQGRHGHQYTVKESKTVSASITRHSTATVLPQDVPAVTRLIFVRTDGGHF